MQQVFARFTKLRFLNMRRLLDKNRVARAETENFIEAISSLSSLEYLNLGWNENLYNIPDSIGKLSKLCTLDLTRCVKLESLPPAISGIDSMKSVHVEGCDRLDKSTLALLKNVATVIPYFVVHAGDNDSNSNLCQLENENPTELEISGLENVKSVAEAQRIKLVEKQRIIELGLVWSRDAKRFVDDEDVLKQLVPPHTIGQMRLQGYSSAGFPSWMMDIASHLPCLVDVTLENMPNCSRLPPLGLLPNLKELRIGRMDSIRKIGKDLYGVRSFTKIAFPRLDRFHLHQMECLAEWNTSDPYPNACGEDGSNKELAFPNLQEFIIADCPILRFKSLSPLAEQTATLALCKKMVIIRSSQVISSSWECIGRLDASSSAATTSLCTEGCEAPLHQCSLLHHLPSLKDLVIEDCSDLTWSSIDLRRCLPSLETLSFRDCKSMAQLPENLGYLSSLKKLDISNCEGVKALPESMTQPPESMKPPTGLQCLKIFGCPLLVQWCISKENKVKLKYIKTRVRALRTYQFIIFFICIE
jgi:Leucine-rich repeat (LRR) protein